MLAAIGAAKNPHRLLRRWQAEQSRGAMSQSPGEIGSRECELLLVRHCEESTGPREARPDDRLRDEAIHISLAARSMDCFAALAMTIAGCLTMKSETSGALSARHAGLLPGIHDLLSR
jgi:hypothetical protein